MPSPALRPGDLPVVSVARPVAVPVVVAVPRLVAVSRDKGMARGEALVGRFGPVLAASPYLATAAARRATAAG